VVGGEVRAFGEVSVSVLGGEGCQTHIRILDKEAEAAKLRIKEIEHLREQIHPKIAPIETRLKGMKVMLAKYGATMSEKAKADVKGVADAYSALKKAEHDLEAEKERLHSVVAAVPKHVGRFAATEKIVWGGILEMYGHHRELEEGDAHKEWLWAPTGLASRSIIPDPAGQTPGASPVPPAAPPA